MQSWKFLLPILVSSLVSSLCFAAQPDAWALPQTAPDFTIQTTSDLAPASIPAGQSASATLTITPLNGSTQTINFTPSSCSAGLPSGAVCSFSPNSVSLSGGVSVPVTLTITTAANMALPSAPPEPQTITVTATASGAGSTSHSTNVDLTVTATNQTFTIASTNGSTFPVSVGGTAQVDISVTGTNGFINNSNSTTVLPITYTCSGIPTTAEITCTFSPGLGQSISPTTLTLNLVTQGVTGQMNPPGGGSIFYAFLLPALFGVVLTAGSRTRGVRVLGLIVVLGCSTLWLGSCGGSSSSNGNSQPNSGTPPGIYPVTINATTLGPVALTSSMSITLAVGQ